jgi:hypothetical protein
MLVFTEKNGPVTTITINRPEVPNAVDRPRSPPTFLLSDRRSAYEQFDLPQEEALGHEFCLGLATIQTGETLAGAGRFAGGAGREFF